MAIVVAGSIDVYRATTSDLISGRALIWGVGHSFGVKNKNMKFTDCFYQVPGTSLLYSYMAHV